MHAPLLLRLCGREDEQTSSRPALSSSWEPLGAAHRQRAARKLAPANGRTNGRPTRLLRALSTGPEHRAELRARSGQKQSARRPHSLATVSARRHLIECRRPQLQATHKPLTSKNTTANYKQLSLCLAKANGNTNGNTNANRQSLVEARHSSHRRPSHSHLHLNSHSHSNGSANPQPRPFSPPPKRAHLWRPVGLFVGGCPWLVLSCPSFSSKSSSKFSSKF